MDPATKTHLVTETEPEISKIQTSTKSSSTCGIISSIMHLQPQQTILPSATLSEFSTSRDTAGHDRRYLVDFSENESEDSHGNFSIDNSLVSDPSGAKNLIETASSIELATSNPSNLVSFSSAEVEPTECEELALHSFSAAADLRIEEGDGSVNADAIAEPSSLIDKDTIMAEASTAPIPATPNVDQGLTLALCPQPEPTAKTCDSSGMANGVISTLNTSVECERHEEVSMDSLRAKIEPIFARGFLDKPVGKKSTACKRTAKREDQGASSSSKSNGYSNGHLNFGWGTEMANGNADDEDTISSDSNMISIPLTLSNGYRHCDRAECNGTSSFHDNGIEEFRRELSCSSFETSADMRCKSSSNGDGGLR